MKRFPRREAFMLRWNPALCLPLRLFEHRSAPPLANFLAVFILSVCFPERAKETHHKGATAIVSFSEGCLMHRRARSWAGSMTLFGTTSVPETNMVVELYRSNRSRHLHPCMRQRTASSAFKHWHPIGGSVVSPALLNYLLFGAEEHFMV